MIRLLEKTYIDSAPNVAVNEMIKMQKELGLGDPTEASKSVKKTYKGFNRLKESFKLVENPNEYFFNLNHPGQGSVLPKYAIVKLEKNRRNISFTVLAGQRREFRANLPLIPKSILALCKKVKEIAPSIKFSMILEPNWQAQPEKRPQGDPVIVGRLGNEWFEIGHWGGDADLILELMDTKKVVE